MMNSSIRIEEQKRSSLQDLFRSNGCLGVAGADVIQKLGSHPARFLASRHFPPSNERLHHHMSVLLLLEACYEHMSQENKSAVLKAPISTILPR